MKRKGIRMQIEEIKTEELKPYSRNPRKNDTAVDAVAKSIQEFGFKIPIVIDSRNEIVCGHTRWKAAKKLGMESVPCIRADDLTPQQIKAFRLVDNKTSELAEWDFDMLDIEIGDITDIDLGVFGFEDEPEEPEAEEDDYQVQLLEDTITKPGDIYRLGDHLLICGDSTDLMTVQKLFSEGETADLVVTDPPYNVAYHSKAGSIQNDDMGDSEFYEFLHAAFNTMQEVMKPGGVFYIWHADSEGINFRTAVRNSGLLCKQCLIWVKNSLVLGRQDYQWQHEPCLYGWKPGAAHYFIDDRTQTTVIEDQHQEFRKMRKEELVKLLEEMQADKISTTIIREDKPSRSDEHPTMKPIKLLARGIKNSSRPGEIVLDLFGGSGSTMMACEQLGRKCRMVELDPKYCDVIVDRWERLTGKRAEKIVR